MQSLFLQPSSKNDRGCNHSSKNDQNKHKILIVDDNALNRKIAERLLEDKGFIVELAENGKEAVSKYQAYPARYCAILMDCQMPIMNGLEATKAIRRLESKAQHIPIIALTTEKDLEQDCVKAGMDAFAEKPINIIELHQTLVRLIQNL